MIADQKNLELFFEYLSKTDSKDLDMPMQICIKKFVNKLEEESCTDEEEEDEVDEFKKDIYLEDELPQFQNKDSDFLTLEEDVVKSVESEKFFDALAEKTNQQPGTLKLLRNGLTTTQENKASLESTTQNSELNEPDKEEKHFTSCGIYYERITLELISSIVEMMVFRDNKLSHIARLDNNEKYAPEEWTREPKLRAYRRELISYIEDNKLDSKGVPILILLNEYLASDTSVSFHQAEEFINELSYSEEVAPAYCQTILSMIKKICFLTFKAGKVRPDSDPVVAFTTNKDIAQKLGIKSGWLSALKGCPVANYCENLGELFPNANFFSRERVDIYRRGDWSTGAEVVEFCKNKCMAFTGSSSHLAECAQCGTPRDSMYKYFYFSPREKVRDFFENKALARAIKDARNRKNTEGGVDDFFNGKLYKLLSRMDIQNAQLGEDYQEKICLKYFESPWDLAFMLSFESIPVTSGNSSYNIVVARCLNLPPAERNKASNIIKLMAFPDGVNPVAKNEKSAVKDWDSFFYPFIKDSALASTLGYTVYDADIELMVTVRHHFVLSVTDTPASCELSGFSGYTSDFPCLYCLDRKRSATLNSSSGSQNDTISPSNTPTVSSSTNKTRKSKPISNRGGVHKKVKGLVSHYHPNIQFSKPYIFRSKARSIEWYYTVYKQMSKDLTGPVPESSPYTKRGLSRISTIFCLGSMVPDKSFPPDLMYLSYSNIGTEILNTVIYGKDGPSEFKSTAQDSIVKFLESFNEIDINFVKTKLNMTTITEGIRTSTPAELTADETKQILNFLFGIVMKSQYESTDPDYLALVTELVLLFKLLSLPRFSENLLQRLQNGMDKFLNFFEEVYLTRPENLPFLALPIHTLRHLVVAIRNVGPLRAIWGFGTNSACWSLRWQMKRGKVPYLTFSDRYVYESITEGLCLPKYIWSKGLRELRNPLSDAETEEEENRRAPYISKIYEYLIQEKFLKKPSKRSSGDVHIRAKFYQNICFLQRNFDAKIREYARVRDEYNSSYHIMIDQIIEIDSLGEDIPTQFVIGRNFSSDVVKPRNFQLKFFNDRSNSGYTTIGYYIDEKEFITSPQNFFSSEMQVIPLRDIICPVWLINDGDLSIFVDPSFVEEYKTEDGEVIRTEEYDDEEDFNDVSKKYMDL